MDTSAVIESERRGKLPDIDGIDPQDAFFLPAIVWAELLIGVRLARSKQFARRRRDFLDRLRALAVFQPFCGGIAEAYADIACEVRRGGVPIPQNDIAVAATARFLGVPVVVSSNDEVHFRRVYGLSIAVLRAD